jgi:hypothetical protein
MLIISVRGKQGEIWEDRLLILHYGNTSSHSSLQTSQSKQEKRLCCTLQAWLQLLSEFKNVLEGKCFYEAEDVPATVKKEIDRHSSSGFKKNIWNSDLRAGDILKNWRQITLKNPRLLIIAACKIN